MEPIDWNWLRMGRAMLLLCIAGVMAGCVGGAEDAPEAPGTGTDPAVAAPISAPLSTGTTAPAAPAVITATDRPEDAAVAGTLALERPTLICLGAHWQVTGDANHNAKVSCHYRKASETAWHKAQDFFRVDSAGLPPDIDKGWEPPTKTTV